jgi:hypothetical protein
MNRKRVFLTILSSVCLAATMLAGPVPASAQKGGFGTSTSSGSGGIATGPTGFTGVFGGVPRGDRAAWRRVLRTSNRPA